MGFLMVCPHAVTSVIMCNLTQKLFNGILNLLGCDTDIVNIYEATHSTSDWFIICAEQHW